MNRLRFQDLKPGVYFTNDYGGDKYVNLVVKVDELNRIWTKHISGDYTSLTGSSHWSSFSSLLHVRQSTPEEVAHMDACIRAGHYIPPAEVPKQEEADYELY